MKLPHPLLNSKFFIFAGASELLRALAGEVSDKELGLIGVLAEKGLPPITSRSVLATMLGVSPGLVWSFVERPRRYYREFSIPKGLQGERKIQAPRIALKIVQKWLSIHFERAYIPPSHVYGFVQGRSHIMAAMQHTEAQWVFSVDIRDFFQTTPCWFVAKKLMELGYEPEGAGLVASLCCYSAFLAQGAPSSPVLSNICFQALDESLFALSEKYGVRLTRYADDIVFSGTSSFPVELKEEVLSLFADGPWALSDHKIELSIAPIQRLKVHGLLVHGEKARLTKGYRNRLRGFKHVLATGQVREEDVSRLIGHLNYADMVERVVGSEAGTSPP